MFILMYVNYDQGQREDRVQWNFVFEDREDAQHKADSDNDGLRNHLNAMARMSASVNRWVVAVPVVDETTQGWTYVEEWEFMPSTRKPTIALDGMDDDSADEDFDTWADRHGYAPVGTPKVPQGTCRSCKELIQQSITEDWVSLVTGQMYCLISEDKQHHPFQLVEEGVRGSQDTPGLGGVPEPPPRGMTALAYYLGTDLIPTVAEGYDEHIKRVAAAWLEDNPSVHDVYFTGPADVGKIAIEALAESGGSIHDQVEDASDCRCGVAGHLNDDGTRKNPLPCETKREES